LEYRLQAEFLLYESFRLKIDVMTFDRQQQAKEILQSAATLPGDKRTAFINERCAGDETLRTEIESLLRTQDKTRPLFETAAETPTLVVSDYAPLVDHIVGKRIGAYEIVSELGRGGMGAVYKAVRADEQFKKSVAIKIIKRGMDTDFVVQRFRQERQILANLDHPNIARLLDGGTTEEGLPYIVMEYIEGKSITRYCDDKKLTTPERLNLFRQVCSAIHYAHQNLIVHRDIKPGNILVTHEGQPKVLDFGIAKLLAPDFDAHQAEMTAHGVRLMTPAYASPEQAKGEAITTASDTYSLGVLLYELLTGLRPYEITSTSPLEIARIICEQEPDKPSTAIRRAETTQADAEEPSELPTSNYLSAVRKAQPDKLRRQLAGDLDNIILKAMRKEPQRRYASVEQFSEDLRRHLEGLPILARTDSFRYRAEKFVRRHKAGVAAATIFIVLLLLATGVAIQQARLARRERDKAEQRFNQVRKLANAVLFDYHDGIARLSGSTPVRERMVKDALEYLDNLSQESSNDSSLQRELASAYEKVGLVQGNPFQASFGDYQGALDSQKKALLIREALVKGRPDDGALRAELAKSHTLLGDLSKVTGQSEDMFAHYEKAQEILESVNARQPNDSGIRRDMGILYIREGRALLSGGKVSEALELFRKSLALTEELSAAEPNNVEIRRDLYLANMFLGDALTEAGKLTEALAHRRTALSLVETMAEADTQNAQLRRDVGVALQRLADTQTADGDYRAALENNRRALGIDEELVAADPPNAQGKRDLIADYQKIGRLLVQLGSVDEALAQQRKALAIAEALAAAADSNAEARADLSNCYYKIGDALMAKKDLRGALQNYRRSLAIDEALVNQDPNNADTQLNVAESYITVGDITLQLGDTQGAMQSYRKAQAIYESLSSPDAAEDSQLRNLAIVEEKLGDVFVALATHSVAAQAENWREANRLYQQSLEGWTNLQKRNALTSEETQKPEEVAQKVAKADAALGKLKAQ
jgi:serine/threonine protein kinase